MSTDMDGTPFHSADATGEPSNTVPHEAVTIIIKPSGAYVINGPVTVLDAEGRVIEPPRSKNGQAPVKLCGCGKTQQPPFCDGSHQR